MDTMGTANEGNLNIAPQKGGRVKVGTPVICVSLSSGSSHTEICFPSSAVF